MIYIDIDGVIRDLMWCIIPRPKTWIGGIEIFELVENDPTILLRAPTTQYCYPIFRNIKDLNFLSCQPIEWRLITTQWIKNILLMFGQPNRKFNVKYVMNPKSKIDMLSEEDVIIEDYPYFKDNSRVVLIDHEYNREVKDSIIRVSTSKELINFLNKERERCGK